MKVLHTPDDAAPYLQGLNAAFGHWGGAAEWDWTFVRTAGDRVADRLVVTDDAGDWIAGSGVSWRQVTGVGRVGIMTGSWTLPAARGQGCFSTFIRESAALVGQAGGVALLSFVTATNPSRRRLEASGAYLVPTGYVRSVAPWTEAPAADLQPVPITPEVLTTLWALHTQQGITGGSFAYPDAATFAAQFLHRPLPTGLYRDASTGAWVIFEHAPDTDRLLFLGAPDVDPRAVPGSYTALAAWAGARDRKFFGFTIDPVHVAAAQATPLDQIPGFLCVNGASTDPNVDPGPGPAALRTRWVLQSGDRM